jgi:hypothetical protein
LATITIDAQFCPAKITILTARNFKVHDEDKVIYIFFFVLKGTAADATDAPQP